MASFGIPIGMAFGISFENMAFLGVGIAIGIVVGIQMDKKAFKEGRQLVLETQYIFFYYKNRKKFTVLLNQLMLFF